MLEHLVQHPTDDLSRIAIQVAEKHGLKPDKTSDLIHSTQRVIRSSFWQRARVASIRMCEVAFETCDLTISEQPTVVRGVIDLVFQDRHESPWVIVDYKTDRDQHSGPTRSHSILPRPGGNLRPLLGKLHRTTSWGTRNLLYEYRSLRGDRLMPHRDSIRPIQCSPIVRSATLPERFEAPRHYRQYP